MAYWVELRQIVSGGLGVGKHWWLLFHRSGVNFDKIVFIHIDIMVKNSVFACFLRFFKNDSPVYKNTVLA